MFTKNTINPLDFILAMSNRICEKIRFNYIWACFQSRHYHWMLHLFLLFRSSYPVTRVRNVSKFWKFVIISKGCAEFISKDMYIPKLRFNNLIDVFHAFGPTFLDYVTEASHEKPPQLKEDCIENFSWLKIRSIECISFLLGLSSQG